MPAPHTAAATAPAPPCTRARTLALVLAAALLALLAVPALVPSPARAVPPSSVEVSDTTGKVDPELLESRLGEVDFRREVRLVVLSLDVTEHGATAEQDTALNDAVLDLARTDEPTLLSEDGTHWADGTVIIALDPENRFLGAYAGEDVKLSDSGFDAVQDAMRDHAEDGDWAEALEDGARTYASLLDRPWWRHPGVLVAAVAVLLGALSAVALLLHARSTARGRTDRAVPRHDEVLRRRAVTDAAARTLPESSPYARAAVLAHERFGTDLAEAARLREALPGAERRGIAWGLRRRERTLAAQYGEVVDRLDEADDDILAASDLLHRTGDWRAAWEQELQPLRGSLDALDELRDERDGMSAAEQASADRVLALGADVAGEIDALTARFEADAIDPDSALEELDTLTRELSAAVEELAGVRIESLAEDESEQEILREALAAEEPGEHRSLRDRRRALERGGGADGSVWHLSPVLWYSSWHHDSAAALEAHRSPSSTAGGTTGYSAGGFSGAGASSRF